MDRQISASALKRHYRQHCLSEEAVQVRNLNCCIDTVFAYTLFSRFMFLFLLLFFFFCGKQLAKRMETPCRP